MIVAQLIIQFLIVYNVQARKQDYTSIYEQLKFDEKMKLLQPSSIIQHYNESHKEIKETISSNCYRDFGIYLRALSSRESWAVRSKF